MSNCPICQKQSNVTCICGFCQECIKSYGHEECSDMLKTLNNAKCDSKIKQEKK